MMSVTLPVAYVPLVDSAPLIIAHEMGFAVAEGINLDLIAAPSWSSVRDMLAFGRVDAAHLLSCVPVAMGLGLGGVAQPVSAVSVLSLNGNVLGVSRALETRMRSDGYRFDFRDATAAAAALARAAQGQTLTFGVPFPFSMHMELLSYWLENTALRDVNVELRTVPPPLMAGALAAGDVDAFCVGEPWGSISVEREVGALLLPGTAVWSFAPEKVLAVRTEWAETEPHLLGKLMRAVWRAGRWLSDPDHRTYAAQTLSHRSYLDMPPEIIDRALSGHLTISPQGEQREVPAFLEFHKDGANYPWCSHANWIAHRLAQRYSVQDAAALEKAGKVFRADIYRREMAQTAAILPAESGGIDGGGSVDMAADGRSGRALLRPDSFFGGTFFDPERDNSPSK